MTRKPFVEQNDCIGCSACTVEGSGCPEVFEVKESQEHGGAYKSFVKETSDYEQYADKIDSAIAVCPVTCIKWIEK